MGKYVKMRLSLNDIKYLFFRSKNCPLCNHKLKKEVQKDFIGNGNAHIGDDHRGTTFINVDKYNIDYIFICESCGSKFPLKDLSKK